MALTKQAKVLSKSQVKAVLAYLSTKRHAQRNTLMFLFSVKAGLRAKEIAELKWSYVLNSDGSLSDFLSLPNTASKGKGGGRVLPLSSDLKKALSVQSKNGVEATDYIIQSQKGSGISNQSVINFFSNLYKELGFEGASSHSGRRTAITSWARNVSTVGGSLRDVQMLAGHSALNTTQRYIEENESAKVALVDL